MSPQYLRYAAGSEKEKGAGGRLHGGTTAHPFVYCNGGVAGAPDSGVRPPMGTDGLVLACALHQRRVWLSVRRCPTGPPSNVFRNRGTPPVPPAGAAPPAPLLGEMRKAPSFHLAHRPTLLGTGGLTILPRKQRPLRPAWGRRGTGTEAPGGAWERGMGALRSAIQHGHSAVIAPTAVRPRCDGLFPAGAALRRFSEQGDTLHPRRGLRALHVAWGRDGGVVISRWRVGSPFLACP